MMNALIHTRRNSQTGRRHGFTLVELLVVIAIIGVLVSLLLPAVQAAREAARRCSCINNLSQLGLAIHNYEFAVEHLPAGVINPDGPIRSEPMGQHVSWIVQILPYIEMQNAYNLFDFEAGAYAPENALIRQAQVSILMCPSYPGANTNPDQDVAFGTYAGCHHHEEAPIDADNTGLLFLNSRLRYADILDGSSQTLLLGEIYPYFGDEELGWVSGTRATLRNTSGNNKYKEARRLGRHHFTRSDNPFDAADVEEEPKPRTVLLVGGFDSAHPGIVNTVRADGSCKSLSEDTDAKVLRQLGNRADGTIQEEY